MITVEYYTLDKNLKDVKVDQEFTITQEMIIQLIEEQITLDKSIGEHIDDENIFIKKR